ncbi:MAG: 4Fe-4S dicluster domain-containing protein [Spirochaetia bacterium]|nr:4Fe-4S dicluster domain-containing protein [Spirochaetia bacterium]
MKLDNEVSRKEFLKLTGLATVLGVGGSTFFGLYAQENQGLEKNNAMHDQKTKVRYGLVVDTHKCKEGCTDCITACHSKHNVPDHKNKKDEIKWIWKEPAKHLFASRDYSVQNDFSSAKPFLTLCNHCKNPPCVRVCPTQATWKRKDDGIVMMDYHRCIGCRFCMAACPYGSRSFNWVDPRKDLKKPDPDFPTRTIGVVEKCNFCEEIVGEGKLPHCVKNCKEGALTFGNLNDPDSEVRQILVDRPSMTRKPELGTGPSVFYLV